MDKWIDVAKQLPNKKTRYAGTYGVTVLGFDKQEYIDSGYCTPSTYLFMFKENRFETLVIGGKNESEFIPAPWVSHWMQLPKTPKINKGE